MSITNIKYIKYTWEHKKAFLKIQKELTGTNTLDGYLHDLDKIILYFFGVNKKTVQKIHRKYTKHHDNGKKKTKEHYILMIIDWECARYTKPDKQLTALQTVHYHFPHLTKFILPILKEFNLNK